MMKVNTKDTDSLFEKGFAKYLFNSEKKPSIPDRFNKSFLFSIYCLFSKALLRFRHFLSRRAPVNNFEIFEGAPIYLIII